MSRKIDCKPMMANNRETLEADMALGYRAMLHKESSRSIRDVHAQKRLLAWHTVSTSLWQLVNLSPCHERGALLNMARN